MNSISRPIELRTAGFDPRKLFGLKVWEVPLYELREEFRYQPKGLEEGEEIVVPAGFIFDGASIYRPLWSILHPMGRYRNAALIHDYLYRTGIVSRARADEIFLEAMEELEVPWRRRRLMYRAVRLFGRESHNAA